MFYEYLKRILKFAYAQQWRIWAGLIIIIFVVGSVVRWAPQALPHPDVQVNTFSSPTPEAETQLKLAAPEKSKLSTPAQVVELPVPVVPPAQTHPAVPPQVLKPLPSPTVTTPGKTYVVQKGDSLWKLAEAWFGDGYQYLQIARANDLPQNARLEIGQQLRMPSGPSIDHGAWSSQSDFYDNSSHYFTAGTSCHRSDHSEPSHDSL